MSKSRIVKSILVASLAVSPVAMAATSGSVTLGGSVASTLEITSVDTAGASALDLTTAGPTIVQVADIEMSTNNEQGLTLTASSGNLTKTGGTSIAFQVTSVADGATAPTTFAIASGSNYTVGTSAAGSVLKDLYIKYSPATLQDPGAYGGSISLVVSDN